MIQILEGAARPEPTEWLDPEGKSSGFQVRGRTCRARRIMIGAFGSP